MKKILLLPLVALLCMGCSKDAMTADPDMAVPQTTQQDGPYPIKLVVVYGSVFQSDPRNPLTISYTGEDWDMHSFTIMQPGTYEFVARGGSVTFSGHMKYDGHAPYVNLKYQPDDESMGYLYQFTMPESIELTHGIPIGEPIFNDWYSVVVSFEEAY